MNSEFKLEKWVWSEDDFDHMGWHDCPVYALRFDDHIYLDIDYIFQWNHPDVQGMPFTFWMAPATLVFEKPTYFKLDIEVDFRNGFEIADILRQRNENEETIWRIATQEGDILIGAEKFQQIIRRPPSFQFGQAIASEERGEVSFALSSDENYLPSPEISLRKTKELKLYSLVEQRHILKVEKEKLGKEQLGTKTYLILKRDIEKRVADIDLALIGSRFEYWTKL